VDWQRLMPPKGFRVLPRRWVVERTYAWISHNPVEWARTTRGCVLLGRPLSTRR
jgi:transposase